MQRVYPSVDHLDNDGQNGAALNGHLDDDGNLGAAASAEADQGTFGGQNIGLVGSIALMVNNVIGPGLVALPYLYQQAGWLVPTLCIIFAFFMSTFASSMICQTIQSAPGNQRLTRRQEYCDMVLNFIGPFIRPSRRNILRIATQLLYNVCLGCLNTGSIIVTAQTVDQLILFICKHTWALELYPHPSFQDWPNVPNQTPFHWDSKGASDPFVISLGYVISAACIMPMGFMTLSDNIWMQFMSFGIFTSIVMTFLGFFIYEGLHDSVPMIGSNPIAAVGVAMFCYSYAVAVPSWVNEKSKHVSINQTIWGAAIPSTICKISFGWLGALSFRKGAWQSGELSDNALASLSEKLGHNALGVIMRILDYGFSIAVIGFGIPLFHIFVRYNLVNGGMCSPRWAAFWGVIFPWLISWAVYNGTLYVNFMNFSSLAFNTIACYFLPFICFLCACVLCNIGKRKTVADVVQLTPDELGEETEGAVTALPDMSAGALNARPQSLHRTTRNNEYSPLLAVGGSPSGKDVSQDIESEELGREYDSYSTSVAGFVWRGYNQGIDVVRALPTFIPPFKFGVVLVVLTGIVLAIAIPFSVDTNLWESLYHHRHVRDLTTRTPTPAPHHKPHEMNFF